MNEPFAPIIGDGYFEKRELASELHVSVRTLDRWHVERRGPPRTVVGRLILYRRSSVLEWLSTLEDRYGSKAGQRKARRLAGRSDR